MQKEIEEKEFINKIKGNNTNDIKEILDSLKFVIDNPTLEDELGDKQVKIINYTELNAKESKQLLDYITNLQEENKNLKNEQISKYQTLKELQEEINELKAKLEMYENGVYYSSENDKLQQKIDKAIEYLKSNEFIGKIRLSSENKQSINKLLNILQGNKWNEVERAYLDDKPIGSGKE